MEILPPISTAFSSEDRHHAAVVSRLKIDAQQAAQKLRQASEKLQLLGNDIMSCPNKLECPSLGFEEFSNIRGLLQTALKKYEHACYLKAHLQYVLEFS